MTESNERTLGILLAKVEGIEGILARAEQSRANMHRRLDDVVDDVGTVKTDIEKMRGTVTSTAEIADEVRAWKQRGIGALGVVGFGASALTWIVMHWFDRFGGLFR